VNYQLAPPFLPLGHDARGRPNKKAFGQWVQLPFRVLARLKFLRGTALDPFGRTADRRTERRLITEYEALIEEILGKLDHEHHRTAVALATLPEQIRGYGHVKQAHLDKVAKRQAELLAAFRAPAVRQTAAE